MGPGLLTKALTALSITDDCRHMTLLWTLAPSSAAASVVTRRPQTTSDAAYPMRAGERRHRNATRLRTATRGFLSGGRALPRLVSSNLLNPFLERNLQTLGRSRLIVEVRHSHARQPFADRVLDLPQLRFFFRCHQCERVPCCVRASRSTGHDTCVPKAN